MMEWMARLSIRARIYVGFLGLLAALLGLALENYRVMTQIARLQDEFAGVSRRTVSMVDLVGQVSELRRLVADYVDAGVEAVRIDAQAAGNLAQKHAADLMQMFSDPGQRASAAQIRSLIEEYCRLFEQVAASRARRDQIYQSMAERLGPTMSGHLKEIYDRTASRQIYEAAALAGGAGETSYRIRLGVYRYLETGDEENAVRAAALVPALKDQLTRLIDSVADADSVTLARQTVQDVTAYLDALQQLRAAIRDYQTLVTTAMKQKTEAIASEASRLKDVSVTVLADLDQAQDADIRGGIRVSATTAAIALVVGCLLGWLITRGITIPLRRIIAVMTRLSGGDKSVEVPYQSFRDEVGAVAAAVAVFKDNALAIDRMTAEQDNRDRQAAAEKRRALAQLADGFEQSVKGIVDTVSSAAVHLQENARGLSASADQANQQATAVAAAAEQASANVQTVALAAEQLSGSVGEIGRQVAESTRVASAAVEEASKTNTTVAGLTEAAQRIGEVVGLINSIAGQTNLLALNATIEAARAGDAGKGFAVVASEVKNLAGQTARATDEIKGQVDQIQSVTGAAVEAIRRIGGIITRMNEIGTTIASAVEERAAATREIARNVQEAAAGTREVSTNITGVTGAADETGRMATGVLSAADQLSRQSDQLRQEVDRFIGQVRGGPAG